MRNENQIAVDEDALVDVAKNCIGLDRKKPYRRQGKQFYRPCCNFYATVRNDKTWEQLYRMGYASRWPLTERGYYEYWLTRAGLDWLGEKLGIYIHDEEGQTWEGH